MADIIPQWLRHPSSTNSTYGGISDSLVLSEDTMPRLLDNNWRSQPNTAPSRNARAGQSSRSGRSGRQGEYCTTGTPTRGDIYAAVDSWRAYSNDTNTLQASVSGQSQSSSGFDPYSQVFSDQAYGRQNAVQTPYPSWENLSFQHNNARCPNQPQSQTQNYYAPQITQASANVHYGTIPSGPESRWPSYGQYQTRVAPSHLRPYEPLRSNGAQEKSQACQFAPGGRGAIVQPTFVQHVPMRPARGAAKSRGYASSRDLPIPSIESQVTPNRQQRSRDGPRRNHPKQNTPLRDNVTVTPPQPPCATQAYLSQAHLEPEKLTEPQRLLVILDLNGTLMLKPDYRKPNKFDIRPGAPKLLEYLFANHTVMVSTSGQPHNAEIVARGLFSSAQYDMLAAIWARDKLDLTSEQYRAKVQVYKKLDKIWANDQVQSSFFPVGTGKWDQTNTILVDDSHLKALQEPHNLLQVTEFTGKTNGLNNKAYKKHEEQICQSLITKLEVLKWQNDVSRLVWRWQTGKAEIPKVPGTNFFVDEKVDQKEQARRDLEAAMNLPTPQSPVTTDSEKSDDEEKGKGKAKAVTTLLPGNLEASVTPERKRSESPLNEAVFKELLDGGNDTRDTPTPESQHA